MAHTRDTLGGHQIGLVVECDGPEDSLFFREIGNASRLFPKLHGKSVDKLDVIGLAALKPRVQAESSKI
jgi:hypothetical protein